MRPGSVSGLTNALMHSKIISRWRLIQEGRTVQQVFLPLNFRTQHQAKSIDVSSAFVVQQIIPKSALNRSERHGSNQPNLHPGWSIKNRPTRSCEFPTPLRVFVGGQKKARVFKSTTCQNNGFRLCFGTSAVKGTHIKRFDPRSIFGRVDVCNVRMH